MARAKDRVRFRVTVMFMVRSGVRLGIVLVLSLG